MAFTINLALCLLLTCLMTCLADHHFEKRQPCEKPTATDIKTKQLYHLVDTINKPVHLTYTPEHHSLNAEQMSHVGKMPQNQPFSLFDDRNWNEATYVLKLLLKAQDFNEFINRATVLREHVNEDLLYYALSFAVQHRNDTQGINLAPVHRVFPDKFLKTNVIRHMKELSRYSHYYDEYPVVDASQDEADLRDPNHKIMYFLEDIGMNMHHYHWHALYPALWKGKDLNRKGEFFYWMHRQMVARYDLERLSNGMKRCEPFNNWDSPIEDGYAPHITIDKMGYQYAYRPPHVVLQDLPGLSKNDMLLWKRNILEAVHKGYAMTPNDTKVQLDASNGISILGEMVESTVNSINREFYGNLHSYAHVMAGKVLDPDGRYGGNNGAMYDVATSARDPIFYSWHKFLNQIFKEHKNQLPSYTTEDVDFPGVEIQSFAMQGANTTEKNLVHTFWQDSYYTVGEGFTFTEDSPMTVKVKHLQHEQFMYKLQVNNNNGQEKDAIVRIYLAAETTEKASEPTQDDILQSVVELDRFTLKLKPGQNAINRKSNDSTLITPWNHIFGPRHLRGKWRMERHCGWPEYMQLPKGREEGMMFKLFAIVNDWNEEKVSQPNDDHRDCNNCACLGDAASYCGDHDRPYPSKRALGFPFDRKLSENVYRHGTTALRNLNSSSVTIKFVNEVNPPKYN